MAEPMIQVIGIIEAMNTSAVAMPSHPDVPGEAREEVDQHDLHAVERVVKHGRDESELQQADEGIVVDGGDPVVRLRSPADHRRVHDVGEQEQDDREAGDAVQEPAVLAFVALVQRAELLPLRSVAVLTSGSQPIAGRLNVSERVAQAVRMATRTPSRVGTIVER